ILILNKIDLFQKEHTEVNLDEMKGFYRQHGFENVIFVSAATQENITPLKQLIFDRVKEKHLQIFPNFYKDGYEFSPWPTEAT
ncbi:MAG TPA: hypothetical protein VGK59_03095, partial [Ohtaekwangia sp.]